MLSLSSYFSAAYLGLFLPASLALYRVMPQRGRRAVLLGMSFLFFWAVSGKLLVYLLFSILSMHHMCLWLTDLQLSAAQALEAAPKEDRRALRTAFRRRQRQVLTFAILLQLGMLVGLKYSPFFAVNLNNLLQLLHLPWQVTVPKLLLPMGISFYTMQAMSYLFDVYRQKIQADRNLFRLALYMSFFPQIMEGPICRYEQTAQQLWSAPPITRRNFALGLQRCLYGLMKKVIVADRLNLFIQTVFTQYENYEGFVIALAAVGYTIQLYMDFSGTMDLAVGTGQILGFHLPENFRQPFFSKSISEFWQRWHITLGAWFKDYIFYPVSMSGPLKKLTGRARKRLGNHFGPLVAGTIALFLVWVCNGLWHGAAWSYLFFGMYHFACILLGNLTGPYAKACKKKLHISPTNKPYQVFQIVRTGLLVCIGELFFRANGLQAGLEMFGKMIRTFSLDTLFDRTAFTIGIDKMDWLIVAAMLVVIFLVSLQRERGKPAGPRFWETYILPRYGLCCLMLLAVILFGAYGYGYVPLEPIYAGF